MAEFARLNKDTKYPRREYDGDEDQSYGFLDPHLLQTGKMRGTQVITHTDGSKIVLGIIPGTDNEFGIGFFDSDGNLIKKETGPTDYFYDPVNEVTKMEIGKMPDSTYNIAIAQEGDEVEDAFDES